MNKPKIDVKGFVKATKKEISRKSPQILMVLGVSGMIATTVYAVKATPKALRLIEEEKAKRDSNEKLKPLEVVKIAWKPYVPSAVIGALSISCLIGANSVSMRRTAALATAYKLSETALTEYKDAVIETIGEKKEKAVREKVSENKVKNNPIDSSSIIFTGDGDTLCYDPLSGRYFKSNQEKIRKAVNDVNENMFNGCSYSSLNSFYSALNLETTELGNYLGWQLDTDGLLKVDFDATLDSNGNPCLVIDYKTLPKYDYDKLVY